MIAPLLPGCCMVKWATGGASAPWYLPNEKGRSESGINCWGNPRPPGEDGASAAPTPAQF